jgi:desulfoferrodoxin (superoxide reductase-like protein)
LNRERYVLITLVAVFSLLTLSSATGTVSANVPTVLQIDNISQGSSGKIRLQITHTNANPTHFVDVIEVDVNGQVNQFSQQPQTTDPFTVELDLGTWQGNPTIRARAHCNKHGWSNWSGQIQIPEFAGMESMLVIALAAFASVFLFTRQTRKWTA